MQTRVDRLKAASKAGRGMEAMNPGAVTQFCNPYFEFHEACRGGAIWKAGLTDFISKMT